MQARFGVGDNIDDLGGGTLGVLRFGEEGGDSLAYDYQIYLHIAVAKVQPISSPSAMRSITS